MKSLKYSRGSKHIAMITILAFLSLITLSPTLQSCGGGGSGGGGDGGNGGDGTTTPTFDTFQRTTTDENGKATFTTTKLTNATSAEITFTLPNGQAASGLTVDFSETTDGRVMFVAFDPNGAYQTEVITADVSGLSSEDISAANGELSLLESGERFPVGVSQTKEGFTIAYLILVAGTALVFTVSAISLQDKINKVSGTIDPARLVRGEPDCFSFDNLLDHFEIGAEAIGLVFWTASTITSAGASLTMDELYEILLVNIADNIKDRVEEKFWSEVAAVSLAGTNISSDTKMCWQLHNPFSKYGKIIEMRPDVLCSTAADCADMPSTTQAFNAIDNDGDGYTPDQNDCDDQNPRIYPGAFEVCDSGIDYNCDGATTTCNITTNLFMDPWPEGGGNLEPDGNDDIATLVELQGSFIDMGSETDPDMRVVLNGDPVQRLVTMSYGGGDFGFYTFVQFRSGVNRIQVAANAGSYYGSETYYFNNTNEEAMLTLMLTWDACPDLDLYVVEPNSAIIYSGNTSGDYGEIVCTSADPCVPTTGWGPEIYKALNPAAGQTYFYYVKHAGNGSCGESGHSAFYTVRVYTPYGDTMNSGRISENETSRTYEVAF